MTSGKSTWASAIGLLAVAVSCFLAMVFCLRLDVWLEDYVITTQSKWTPPDNIVIVTISEDTLATLKYRSPIDRAFLSKVVDHIDKAGARAIGIDVLIDQPSEAKKDIELQGTLQNATAQIVVGYAGKEEQLTEKQINYLNQWTDDLERGLVTLKRDDFDGTVRQLFLGREIDGVSYSTLAGVLAQKAGARSRPPIGRITYFRKPDGTPHNFPTYPAHSVPLIPTDWFKGKIVLIGSALPTADLHRTPFSTVLGSKAGSLYGVAIHAHILGQLLQKNNFATLSALQSALLVLAISIVAMFLTTVPAQPLTRIAILAVFLLAFVASAWVLFQQSQTLVPVVTPTVAAVLTALFLAIREWRQDRQGRRFVENVFAQYVSPAVVRRIIAKREKLKLGGEVRRVTYIFTDLEGFTTMCEGLDPEQVAVLLNDYLDRMCALFIEYDATIDKIIGDAVVGFFGAPEEQDDQCEMAVKLALAIDEFAEQYKTEKQRDGYAFGTTRIGVHSGDAVVGNFGGSRFVDYTSIGDTVNSAARMEAVNKHLGTRICVSSVVRNQCTSEAFRPIGQIFLKGKNNEVACFEPIHPERLDAPLLNGYNAAYEAMERNDKGAITMFAKLLKSYPDDPLTTLHAGRLRGGEVGATIVMQEK